MKKFKKIYIEITNYCNLKCLFCSIDTKEKKEMNIEDFEHILKKIDGYTDYVYLHVKGEPLLHSHFEEILALCSKYNKKVNLTTNGTLLQSRVSSIVNTGVVRQINVSLHCKNGEDKKYLDTILKATQILLDRTDINVVYRYWTLPNKKIANEQRKAINYILSFWSLDLDIWKEIDSKDNITLRPHLYLNKGEEFVWPTIKNHLILEKTTCYGLRKHIAILADGTVVPCCLDSSGIISLGNIYKQTLSQIMDTDRVTKIVKNFKNNKMSEELCQKCSYRLKFER